MPRRDDVSVIVQGVNLEFLTHVDYNGPLAIAESVGVADSVDIGIALVRQFNDAVAASDAMETSITFERSFVDAATVDDAFVRTVTFNLDVGDGVVMGDSPSVNTGTESNVTFNESVAVSDNVVMNPVKPLVLADAVAVTDAMATDDPAWRRVSLLAVGTGPTGKQNTTFVDSVGAVAMTPAGGVQQGSVSPFQGAGGSALFTHVGDMITAPVSANYAFGLGDFTVECWFMIAGNSPLDGVPVRSGTLISTYPPAAAGGWDLSIQGSHDYTGTYAFFECGNGNVASVGGVMTQNQWHHLAAVGIGGNVVMYLDGVAGAPTPYGGPLGAPGQLTIGRSLIGGQWSRDFNGYISEVAILKGTAKYLANFTPPVAPYAPAGWNFLCHFDNAAMVDSARQANLAAGGNMQISAQGDTLYFDGVSNYLQADASEKWNFGTGDFTIEMWAFIAGNSAVDPGGQRIATMVGNAGVGSYDDTGNRWYFQMYGDAVTTGIGLGMDVINDGVWQGIAATAPISQNAWHHIAVSKNAGVYRFYLDGTLIGVPGPLTNPNVTGNGQLQLGRYSVGGWPRFFNGHMVDVRITNGTGRYPGNFIPPAPRVMPIGLPTGKPNPVRNFHPADAVFTSDVPAIVNVPLAVSVWDPATAGPSLAVSNGNRDVAGAGGGTFSNIRTQTARSTGKLYFEITNVLAQSQTGGAPGFAFCLPGFNNATYLENSGGMVILTYGEARDWTNTTWSSILPIWNKAGDILCVAVDLTTTRKLWVSRPGGVWNGGGGADPVAGGGGIPIGGTSGMAGAPGSQAAIYAMPYSASTKFHLNTGQDAFAGVVPAGHAPWA